MSRDGLSVIKKATIILERFLDARTTSLSFNDILQGTPMSRATTHRVLADLTENGLLAQDAQRDEYRLGPLALSLGALAHNASGIVERALRRLEVLRDQFGETTILAELREDAVVPVRRIDGLHEMRMNQEVGRRYPAYAGATGRVLLAHLEPARLGAYLAGIRLEALTDRTIISVEELRGALDQVRRAGVAVSRGERVPEAIAISAPIFDSRGEADCALTVSGLSSRWDAGRMMVAAQAVKEAAESVSHDAGYQPTAGEPTAAMLGDPASEPYALVAAMCNDAAAQELPPANAA
jgi:DNA-binding IclR family transcriptional regulator